MTIDFVGKEIHVGDTVVYPRRNGSDIWLSKGQVRSITLPKDLAFSDEHALLVEVDTRGGPRRQGRVPAHRAVVVS